MYKIETSKQFQKDLNLAKKRHLDIDQLFDVVEKLANDMPLPSKNKDHTLKGNFIGYRECHINPDSLLIYKKDTTLKIIALIRTGTHSDLFKK